MAQGVTVQDVPRVSACEVITEQAAQGDGGNAWGPHKCRIVCTADGVFTVYNAVGGGHKQREWRLVWRDSGGWKQLASGDAGREPTNLLASPDGTLHVVGWPGGKARLWSGKPRDGKIEMKTEDLPGLDAGDWPYSAAGADLAGNLCVLSAGLSEKPGALNWVFRNPVNGKWTPRTAAIDYRHCYAFLFPGHEGKLALGATRDVKWETLGYACPGKTFMYAFDATRFWQNEAAGGLTQQASIAEKPTAEYPNCQRYLQDAYVDTEGRTHLIIQAEGASTAGKKQVRHAVVSAAGETLADDRIPPEAGEMCRVFQDDRSHYYLLGSSGLIYRGGTDGVGLAKFADATPLDLGGHAVQREGFFLAVPRTGTPRGNVIDVVFPAGKARLEPGQDVNAAIKAGDPGWHDWSLYAPKWVYVRLQLHGAAAF